MKRLKLNSVNTGTRNEFHITQFIKQWEFCSILLENNIFKIIGEGHKILLQTEVTELEEDFLSKTYKANIVGQNLRLVFTAGIASTILKSKKEPEPFTVASMYPDGFAVHFQLEDL